MFEDSLIASRVQKAGSTRWLASTSLLLQLAVVSCWVTLPLLHPATLHSLLPREFPPRVQLQRAPPKDAPIRRTVAVAHSATTPRFDEPATPSTRSAILQTAPLIETFDPPSPGTLSLNLTPTAGLPDGLTSAIGRRGAGGPAISVRPANNRPLQVSSGVSAGMLLAPIRPEYPVVAARAHVSGTVVLEATIAPDGAVVDIRIITGPALLTGAAVDAVRHARYRPYLLNGRPTAVTTRITINFRTEAS